MAIDGYVAFLSFLWQARGRIHGGGGGCFTFDLAGTGLTDALQKSVTSKAKCRLEHAK